MKIYGRDTGTQLRLTEKAQKAYDATDPITITQYFYHGKMDKAGGYIETPGIRFDITGVLEDWYDQMQELAQQMEGGAQE